MKLALGEMTKSYKSPKAGRQWHVVDAKGQILGRLATRVASLLRGKTKPTFTPHADLGDGVVVINAAEVKLTGKKWQQKIYFRHSTDPGHGKYVTAERMRATHPERLVEFAVKGMLPKNALGRKTRSKLRVYASSEHKQQAQTPAPVELS